MQLPELFLFVGTERRLGCLLGIRMETRDWVLPKDDEHLVAKLFCDLVQRWRESLAVGTLEIRKLNERYGCIRVA